ncbi:MAG: beta-lactamase family protein [Treponema sp.]|nr:beta-lactamase family protein [Treponema sp.]
MPKIQHYLERCVNEGVFPGASWVVGNLDGVQEKGSVGLLGEGLGPVKVDSIYDLASLTKIFVALALMKQLEDGLIRLEDEVKYFLPSYKTSSLGDVSLFALLTHTAPLPAGTHLYRHVHTREELLEAIRSYELRSGGETKVVYTCEAFILLGEIIAAVDAAGLDKVIRRRVLDPLGMQETCFLPSKELLPRIAPTEFCSIRGRVVRGEVHDENAMILGGVSGNAGLFSNALEMARLGEAMLVSLEDEASGNARDSGALLSKASAQLMCRNHTAGMGQNRGLGWMVAGPGSSAGDLLSPSSFGHTGFTGTSLWVDPERKLYALLLSNRIHPRRDNPAIFRTRHIFHNLAVIEYGKL